MFFGKVYDYSGIGSTLFPNNIFTPVSLLIMTLGDTSGPYEVISNSIGKWIHFFPTEGNSDLNSFKSSSFLWDERSWIYKGHDKTVELSSEPVRATEQFFLLTYEELDNFCQANIKCVKPQCVSTSKH